MSDTDRFNKAIGLPAPKFTYDHTEPERKIFAQANFNGMKVQWREHPFQWILEREMSVLREFESGPFEWVTSTVELHPLTVNRTRLIHSFQVKPRGLFGKLMTPIQFRFLTKRSLNRVYSNLERIANDSRCGYACDVSFSKPFKLSKKQRQVLTARVEKLAGTISSRPLAKEFGQLICSVADPMATRIRPIPLSQKLKCSLEQALHVCLRGVEVGLLNMSWDVICPVCKIASGNAVVKSEELVDLSNVYLLAIRHHNADALVETHGDVQVRKYWSQVQQKFSAGGGGCEVLESAYDFMLISCGVLEQLVVALDSFTSSLSPEGIPFKECSYAINSGEIMIGAQENQPSAFGKTVRKTKQLLDGTEGCSLVMPDELYNAIANLETESAESLLSKFAIAGAAESGKPVHLALK